MDEEVGVFLILALWAAAFYIAYLKLWVVRRLRKRVDTLADAAITGQPAAVRDTPPIGQLQPDELRRIQQRLQVLERIAVEKENSLTREIEDLRAAG